MSYKIQCENTSKAYDLAFEKAVLRRLGRLSLVQLDCLKELQYIKVEGIQNRVVITYPAAASEELLSTKDLILIMWEFRRLPYRASDTYEIIATRFRRAAGIDINHSDSSQTQEALDMYAELDAWSCGSANRDHDFTPPLEP